MSTKAGQSISRVRNTLKLVKEDAFITDRFIYSLIMKYGKTLMFRENKMQALFNNTALIREIPCMDLIEVDKVEACCAGIKTGCTFRRTKDKLPKMLDGGDGPLIKSVTSLDYSKTVYRTQPELYEQMTKTSGWQYNKEKYYWFLEDYLYIPDVEWETIRIQALFEESVHSLLCHVDGRECVAEQDRALGIPDHLFSEVEQLVRQEILTAGQIPSDGADDSQNVMR